MLVKVSSDLVCSLCEILNQEIVDWVKEEVNLTHQGSDIRNKRNYGPAACRKETTNTVS